MTDALPQAAAATANNDSGGAAGGDEEIFDEPPTFIDMNSAVEVKVNDDAPPPADDNDDDDMAMEDDDQNAAAAGSDVQQQQQLQPVVDQSKATFTSHSDAIYAIKSHYDPQSQTLHVISGGGDDRAYLHLMNTSSSSPPSSSSSQSKTIPLAHPHTDSISCVSLNTPYIHNDPSGTIQSNHIAVGSYDGSIVLYSTIDGQLIHVFEGPTDVEWLTFHPNGGTVLLSGSIADGTIWMYHTPSKSCLQVFVGHEGGVTAGTFTPDGKWVVSCGQDGTVRIWAPKKGVCKHVFRLMEGAPPGSDGEDGAGGGGGLTCLAVGGGQDGQLAICGGEDGNAYVVHVSGKKVVATLTHYEESAAAAATTAPAASQGGDDGMDEDNDDDFVGEARSVEAVGFCPGNIPGTAHWCATGGVDGTLKIWNMNVGGVGGAQLRQKCTRNDHQDNKAGITRLRWHNSLPLVIVSYTDGVIGIWDARVGTMIGSLTGHTDMINDMDVSFVDGSAAAVIVTGSDDKSVKIFEYLP